MIGSGSSGWQAPEQLRNERQTRAVDLFSLGCVLFFCMTAGKHPYGDNYERDVNVLNDRKDLFLIESLPEAVHLLSGLLNPDPNLRYGWHFWLLLLLSKLARFDNFIFMVLIAKFFLLRSAVFLLYPKVTSRIFL